jgi:hypothetical protein
MTLLSVSTLLQKMVQFSDETYNEERVVEKLFHCIPEKYKQIARLIESLLDLSMMSIEEVIGRLKVVDGDKPQPLSGPITVGEKFHLTREQWEACQGDRKKGESSPSTGRRKRGKPRKARGGAQAGARGCAVGSTHGGDGLRAKPARGGHLPVGNGGNTLLVGVYVDDLVITVTKDAEVTTFKEEMKATFQMSDLGLLSFYLGIEVYQGDSGITIRQITYAKRVVELAGITDCNLALTPMEERLKLSHDSTMEEVDATQYRRLVGSLRYLAHTRPDLAFSVGYISRFMQRQMMEHQQAVKRIIRYVAGTLDHDLYYPRCPGEAHLVRYSDSDHVDDIDTSKSTSGILFFFGKCLISWQSVKQQVVALSSCEAEYIAASTASTQALWLVRLLGDLLGRDTGAVELRVDSKSALALSKNPVFHEWSKHIRVRYHFIRGCLEEGSFKACYINTKDQLEDLLTKPLGRIKFLDLCSRIGMVQFSHKTTHKT